MEITVQVDGADARFRIVRMYNLGSAMRRAETAVAHQEEVAKAGIHIAFDVPAPRIYPIAPYALTTGDQVLVQDAETSGEVEIVVAVADRVYVGVGSDHSDRALERVSIPWSKQVCPNVLAPVLWPFEPMRARWDACVLRSWVDERLYQEVPVAAFLHPDDVIATLRARLRALPSRDYLVFCGTVASLDKALGFGQRWSFELEDPGAGRRIKHAYTVRNLFDEIRDEFRVPVRNPSAPER